MIRDGMPIGKLAELRQKLIEAFSEEELRTLCFDLGIDFDHLAGRAMPDKARELLDAMSRTGRIGDLIERCRALRPNVAWDEILAPIEAESPFKGLEYYDVADASLFYGRETLTARLAEHLAERRLLVVVGASGSGKSSLVRAGLVHFMKTEHAPLAGGRLVLVPGSAGTIHVITPGAHPLESLAVSLTSHQASLRATRELIDDLTVDPSTLHLFARRLLLGAPNDARLLVVVDQFEEVFTLCHVEAERRAFIDNLLNATCVATAGPTVVVIVMRADFYPHCGQYDSLRASLEQDQAYIGRMSSEELRRAVERPARSHGWEFDEGLVDLILRDAGDEPGRLPLLSHALRETWRLREGRVLTFAGYHASGRVGGAVAATADQVFARMSKDEKIITRSIFLRLVEPGEGTQDTRRPAKLTELPARPDLAPEVEKVLRKLADARLVTISRDTTEIAHELLIREWPALREWLDEDREGLRIHRRLTTDAEEWAALTAKSDPGALYGGVKLARAAAWAARHDERLNTLEREFLRTSLAEEARRVTESEAQRRAIETVQRQARVIFARRLAGQCISRLESDHQLALLLGVESYRAEAIPETASALLSALQKTPQLATFLFHVGSVDSVAFSPDGIILAFGADDNTVVLADVSDRHSPLAFALLRYHTGPVYSLAFSPGDKIMASGGRDGSVILWDTSYPRQPSYLRTLVGHEGYIYSMAFSPDGATLATGDRNGSVILWDLSSPESIIPGDSLLTGQKNSVHSLAFSPRGRTLASGGSDHSIILWDLSEPHSPARAIAVLNAHSGPVLGIAFDHNGRTLASGGEDGTTILWDVSDSHSPARIGVPLNGHKAAVSSVAFAPNGRTLVTGSMDSTINVWDSADLGSPDLIGTLRNSQEAPVNALALSPDGKTLAAGGSYNTLVLWDLDPLSWQAIACRVANRNLTRAEWRQYLGPYYGNDAYHKTCEELPEEE